MYYGARRLHRTGAQPPANPASRDHHSRQGSGRKPAGRSTERGHRPFAAFGPKAGGGGRRRAGSPERTAPARRPVERLRNLTAARHTPLRAPAGCSPRPARPGKGRGRRTVPPPQGEGKRLLLAARPLAARRGAARDTRLTGRRAARAPEAAAGEPSGRGRAVPVRALPPPGARGPRPVREGGGRRPGRRPGVLQPWRRR